MLKNRQAKNQKKRYRIPIYYEAESQQPTPDANQGLVFNKWVTWLADEDLHNMIAFELEKDSFLRAWRNKDVGDPSRLNEYQKRIQKLVEQLNGITFEMKTMGRLVIGMGLPHPLENGLVWHHTLGVPFLPGSSIKGMLRSWLETWQSLEQAMIDQIFGKEDSPHQVGNYLFFDSIPVSRVKLQVDVMTPHFPAYYSEKAIEGKEKDNKHKDSDPYPHERSEPVPIPFLTVAPGQTFLFSIAPRNPSSGLDTEQVQSWLEEALHTIGIGAKTAVGYGRFRKSPLKWR